MGEEMRQSLLASALADPSSAMYKGLVAVVRDCDASARRARIMRSHVLIPFHVEDHDQTELETQFGVSIKLKWSSHRSVSTTRVAAFSFLIDSALMEYSGGFGNVVLSVDGDVMTMVTGGLEGRLIERSNATARLVSGYFREDEQLRSFSSVRIGTVNVTADVVNTELVSGGGEHWWPFIRSEGPRVSCITVNHFKTPVGPRQLAYLAHCRGAVVYGAIFFQPEMLIKDSGELRCFPGRYYIDRELDMITLVPASDATMSISHPYSSWKEIVLSNSVTANGKEYLCEKYKSVLGVIYYTLVPIEGDFEVPEVLRSHYFDRTSVDVTEIRHPVVQLSREGVPVGYTTKVSRIMTTRLNEVLFRLVNSTSKVVTPAEAFTVLMDYNNTVVQSLDHVKIADRIDYDEERNLALALALHVNWQRHTMKGTFNVLLSAVKARYAVKDAALYKLAFIALAAWWSKPRVVGDNVDELPVPKVVDWCGTDFSVVMNDADPWIEITQTVGLAEELEMKEYDWFPKIPKTRESEWFKKLLARAAASVRPVVKAVESCTSDDTLKTESSPLIRLAKKKSQVSTQTTSTCVAVDAYAKMVSRPVTELTQMKEMLLQKTRREQGAVIENIPESFIAAYHSMNRNSETVIPVIEVDPIVAMRDDMIMANGGPFERDVLQTGYRMAEVDIVKTTTGSLTVNDSKREIPKQRWARRPVVDAGVEGKRVASQAALLGAVFKRNIGVPANRGAVDLDILPQKVVQRVIDVCYREDWESVLEKHLNSGMWQPNEADNIDFLAGIDEKKARQMLDEFWMESEVDLERWLLIAKWKVKTGRDTSASLKVDHPQTIMYLPEASTNAVYSAMTRRLKKCMNECMRPEVSLSAERSDEEHEEWYNSLQGVRDSCPKTYSYSVDIKCYDRSQDHVGLRVDLEWYRRHGLDKKRLEIWSKTHGVKKATSMMFGIVLYLALGGVSGLWKTLMRNTVINAAALIYAADIKRADLIMIDIKGDDAEIEVRKPLYVETTVDCLSLTFNFSAKFNTNSVRYMCKAFRMKIDGRWIHMADPWARCQSVCTVLWLGNQEDSLKERWISLGADLRHYDNGRYVDAVAEAAQQFYHLSRPMYGAARSLSMIKADYGKYLKMFKAPELIS